MASARRIRFRLLGRTLNPLTRDAVLRLLRRHEVRRFVAAGAR